jgi:hypothetical protein
MILRTRKQILVDRTQVLLWYRPGWYSAKALTKAAARVKVAGVVGVLALLSAPIDGLAQRIDNGVAVFATLDKVTARISKLEVPLNQSVAFGSLKVTPRVCYSRPPTEPPKTTSFVEVEETQQDGQVKKLFSGWMFAESPGLNAVEHPVFDVWLTHCEQPAKTAATIAKDGKAPASGAADPAPGGETVPQRRRPPR